VNKHLQLCAAALLCAPLYMTSVLGADQAALDKDLTALIAAQHLPCGKIVNINTQAERDYLVTCKDGSSYQILPNAQGELAVLPLGQKTR
jgi:hypothetical protein